jgi:hypothetical protein
MTAGFAEVSLVYHLSFFSFGDTRKGNERRRSHRQCRVIQREIHLVWCGIRAPGDGVGREAHFLAKGGGSNPPCSNHGDSKVSDSIFRRMVLATLCACSEARTSPNLRKKSSARLSIVDLVQIDQSSIDPNHGGER